MKESVPHVLELVMVHVVVAVLKLVERVNNLLHGVLQVADNVLVLGGKELVVDDVLSEVLECLSP
jgi:hypothetical protein